MNEKNQDLVFGPVPSRRLGRSVGINNIPPKFCTYSCIYCQLGRTDKMQIKRDSFFDPEDILSQTKQKISRAKQNHQHIDYLTIVSDGEPTLDNQLGHIIKKLKTLSFPVAVITNSSLLYQKDVRKDLSEANWVSVKIDAVKKETWKKIDRPHGDLNLEKILDGLLAFSNDFSGTLCTETMLIDSVNDDLKEIEQLTSFIVKLKPQTSYLSIPTRPPAESWVKPASEKKLAQIYRLFTDRDIPTEYLIGYEGNEFGFTGDAKQDILSIMAVHPMRKDAVESFLKKANKTWIFIERLIDQDKIVKHTLNNTIFYSRKLPKKVNKK